VTNPLNRMLDPLELAGSVATHSAG